jgi:hypothetical protein
MVDTTTVRGRGISINAPSEFLASNGTVFVAKLFYEGDSKDINLNAPYTISRTDKVVDGRTYLSLYRLYMEENDITEARFVARYLHDWYQWNKVSSSSLFRDEIAKWRVDLKAKLLGEMMDTLIEDATSGSKSSKSSAKFLVDKLTKSTKRGKPSTTVVPATEDSIRSITHEVAKDIKRLHLQ